MVSQFEIALLLLICMLFPALVSLFVVPIIESQHKATQDKIQALNKEYWEYEANIKRVKVLENCIIEVEFEPIGGFDLIEYKQKFKKKIPEEIILEL